ncbi:MAG: hypothetical protein ACXVW4_09475 [Nocardioides sp.]
MSEQLTVPPATDDGPDAPSRGRGVVVQVAVQVVGILAVFAAAGALAGVVWEWLWSPPSGVVVHHQWFQDEAGLRGDFSGTGLYVVVAAVAGLLAAGVVAVVFDRLELLTLVLVLVSAALAGGLMHRVGVALGPADPHHLATTARDGTKLPARLSVSGDSPYRAFPGGAMVGLVIVFFGLARRRGHRPSD